MSRTKLLSCTFKRRVKVVQTDRPIPGSQLSDSQLQLQHDVQINVGYLVLKGSEHLAGSLDLCEGQIWFVLAGC